MTQKSLCSCFHLLQKHGTDFFRGKPGFTIASNGHLDERLTILRNNCVWKKFLVGLKRWVIKISTNETFHIKHCILWMDSSLTLGGISNKALSII
mmetsp:Transcript_8777/g.15919  ORF Transcript_8777/g.15919 Transcript_8777/m.15919 type:complete len:95 (-) Transcript_8777:348-632(-)